MLKWIKKLFGITESTPLSGAESDLPQMTEEKPQKIKKATTEVKKVEKPKKKPAKKSGYTEADLVKLSKKEIDEIAEKEFKVKLDRRKKKETMIQDFLKAQKS